jgi:glycosyltransferase involved in cell wall biosynthesis
MSMAEGVTILIPVHNERDAIAFVLDPLRAIVAQEGIDAEVLVVDDGSTDGTADVAATHGARVISIPMNVGYGAALRRGIDAASHDRIVIVDGDASYPLEYTPEMLRRLDRFDLVIGRRTGTTYYRSLLSYPFRLVYLLLVWFVVGQRVPDPNSGFRAFRRGTITEFLPIMCQGFSFTTSMTTLYLLSGRTIDYIAIPYKKRIGTSKIRFVRDMLRTGQLLCSVILLYNPIKLFILLASATFVTGVGLVAAALLGPGGTPLWLSGTLFILFSGVFLCFGFLADLVANLRRRA